MIKKTLIYMPATLLPRMATFIVALVGSHYLTNTEFGYFSLTVIIGELSDNVVTNWARVGMARFGARPGGVARNFALQMAKLLFCTAIIAVCASIILTTILAPERAIQVGFAVVIYIASMALVRFGARLLQISQNHKTASAVDSVRAIIFVGVTVLAMWCKPDNFFVVSLAGSIVNTVVGIISCVTGIARTRRDIVTEFPLRQLAAFAVPLVLVSLLTQMVTNLDKVLLKSMYSAAELGRYALAFSVGRTGFDVLGAAFNTWAFVSLSRLVNEGQDAKARTMLGDQMTMLMAAFLPAGAILIASIDLVATTLFRPAFYPVFVSATPIVVMGAMMINIKLYVYDNVYFLYLKNMRQLFSLAAGAATSVVVGIWLVPLNPSLGGAMVFACGAFISLIVSILASRRYMHIPIHWAQISASAAIALLAYVGILGLKAMLVPALPNLIALAIIGSFGAALLGLSMGLATLAHRRKTPRAGEEPRRYALLANQLKHGGLERVVLALANGIVARGVPITLILRRNKGEYTASLDVRVRVIELGHDSMIAGLPKLLFLLWYERFDVVLSGGDQQNIAAAAANLLFGPSTTFIATEHNNPVATDGAVKTWRTRLARRGRGWLYPRMPHIVTVSDGIRRSLIEQFGCDPEKVTRIYNPIPVAQVAEMARESVEHRWFNSDNDDIPVIVAVGRLHVAKGFDHLLEAFTVLNSRRAVRLLLIGDGPERGALEDRVRALGIGDYVDMPGFQSNPYAYMARGEVFVLSSRWEGFAIVIVEALASGARVVATDCRDGPGEILEGGKFGILVPATDVYALADAIELSLDSVVDPAIGQARARTFSSEIAVGEYLNLLDHG